MRVYEATLHKLSILVCNRWKTNQPSNQQHVCSLKIKIPKKKKKRLFQKCQQHLAMTPWLLLFFCVSAARGLWISRRMFHPEGSFSVIWHLFNICSPAVARQCGLYTAGQWERQNNWVIEGTGFMWSIGQYASDLEVRAMCKMEMKAWPSAVGKYRDLWLK